jgi:hypothetical protein
MMGSLSSSGAKVGEPADPCPDILLRFSNSSHFLAEVMIANVTVRYANLVPFDRTTSLRKDLWRIMSEKLHRPNRDHYFMGIAIAVRERAGCKGQKVGAVIVIEDRIVPTGYNGTPEKMVNSRAE